MELTQRNMGNSPDNRSLRKALAFGVPFSRPWNLGMSQAWKAPTLRRLCGLLKPAGWPPWFHATCSGWWNRRGNRWVHRQHLSTSVKLVVFFYSPIFLCLLDLTFWMIAIERKRSMEWHVFRFCWSGRTRKWFLTKLFSASSPQKRAQSTVHSASFLWSFPGGLVKSPNLEPRSELSRSKWHRSARCSNSRDASEKLDWTTSNYGIMELLDAFGPYNSIIER